MGFPFFPGWVVGNRHVGVAGTAFARRRGSGGGEKRGECLHGCINLVGTASCTEAGRLRSAGCWAGLGAPCPSPDRKWAVVPAAPPRHVSFRRGRGRSWAVGAGSGGSWAADACQEGWGAREGWEPCRGSTRQAPRDGGAERPAAVLPREERLPTALSRLKLLE